MVMSRGPQPWGGELRCPAGFDLRRLLRRPIDRPTHPELLGTSQVESGRLSGRSKMPDEQNPHGLARWRAKHPRKPHRTAMDKLFGSPDGDSEEKVAQRHTSQDEELAAEDRARIVKGSTGGG